MDRLGSTPDYVIMNVPLSRGFVSIPSLYDDVNFWINNTNNSWGRFAGTGRHDFSRLAVSDTSTLIYNDTGGDRYFIASIYIEGNGTTNQTSHLECRNNMCSQVNGSGVNQCSPLGSVCGNVTGSHLECRSLACVSVPGAGNNTCTTNAQCSHLACVNRTCSLVSGPGRAECASKGARCGIVKNETNMTVIPFEKAAFSPSCGFWRRLFRLC